ncbi:hypothetical protein EVAR_96082_1 [Eumeta japonica]|uniref:Uncharacterized protein n=1 Tax=Eumeta variegata TaxID=151549 RepID=A0A4C1VDF2_EUMVA|nr:hypothetical protein EVAR_96082_1 [Eumeta japonica]
MRGQPGERHLVGPQSNISATTCNDVPECQELPTSCPAARVENQRHSAEAVAGPIQVGDRSSIAGTSTRDKVEPIRQLPEEAFGLTLGTRKGGVGNSGKEKKNTQRNVETFVFDAMILDRRETRARARAPSHADVDA